MTNAKQIHVTSYCSSSSCCLLSAAGCSCGVELIVVIVAVDATTACYETRPPSVVILVVVFSLPHTPLYGFRLLPIRQSSPGQHEPQRPLLPPPLTTATPIYRPPTPERVIRYPPAQGSSPQELPGALARPPSTSPRRDFRRRPSRIDYRHVLAASTSPPRTNFQAKALVGG